MPEIDLHTHTTSSDGTMTPAELVAEAARIGLRAVAVTDHDTAAGLPEASRAGLELNIEVVRGVELSVDFSPGVMHILGLWLPPEPVRLEGYLAWLREKRHERNHIIVEKLRRLGFDITYDEILAVAGDAAVGRPHFSRVLMEKKQVSSVRQAFDVYLGPKGKAYVPKTKLTPEKALEVLKAEGATVILAHPCSIPLSNNDLLETVRQLKDQGLDGIEALYSEHTRDQTGEYLGIAHRLDLLVSGGSDFHGSVKPFLHLGTGRGALDVPYSLLEKMKARRIEAGLPV